MAQREDGLWAASTTGREMSRQNGKGDEIEVVELWGLVQRSEAILHTVHDAVLLATQTQQRLLSVLDHRDLRPKKKREWTGTGQQMIEFRNGGIIWYRTRTGGGGRGVDDVDRVVVDEAQHATVEHLAAIAPTLQANSNPQMNVAGTGGLEGQSGWWWEVRKRALRGDAGDFGYVGHTAESVRLDAKGEVVQEPVDVDDRELWRVANPAVVNGRGGGMPALEEELLRLGPDLFAREHLCVWAPPPTQAAAVKPRKMPVEVWESSALVEPVDSYPDPAVAFEVGRDGEWSSVGICYDSPVGPVVELVAHERGVAWLPDALVRLVQARKPRAVGCVAAGATASQIGPVLFAFGDAGVDRELLHQISGAGYRAGCDGLLLGLTERTVAHRDGQGPLDSAVESAAEKVSANGWWWEQRSSEPISPLVAVTVAHHMFQTVEAKPVITVPLFAVT